MAATSILCGEGRRQEGQLSSFLQILQKILYYIKLLEALNPRGLRESELAENITLFRHIYEREQHAVLESAAGRANLGAHLFGWQILKSLHIFQLELTTPWLCIKLLNCDEQNTTKTELSSCAGFTSKSTHKELQKETVQDAELDLFNEAKTRMLKAEKEVSVYCGKNIYNNIL